MFQFTTIIFTLLLPVLALAKDPVFDPAIAENIKPALVHIIPTSEEHLKRLPLGCTGFYVTREMADDRLMIIEDAELVVTSLSCLLDPVALNKPEPEINVIGFHIQDMQGRLFTNYSITRYHKAANIALIKIPKNDSKDTSSIKPVKFKTSKSKAEDKIFFNLARPLGAQEKLISVRFPSAVPSNDVLASTLEIVMPSKVNGFDLKYFFHQGTGQGNGFEGSPILNGKGEVVGVNSYSNFFYFNVGYDLSSLISQSDPEKAGVFSNMNISSDLRTDQRSMAFEDASAIIYNDAFDEALFPHPHMQKSPFEDVLDPYFQGLLTKVSRDPLFAKASSDESENGGRAASKNYKVQSTLFYFQALDYMMDVIYQRFMNEVERIKHSPVSDEKRTKQMNSIAKEIDVFFKVFETLKINIRNNILSTNSFIDAYQVKVDCKFDRFKVQTTRAIAMPRKLGVRDDHDIAELCAIYDTFESKEQKGNYRHLKSEPYPSSQKVPKK